MSAPDYEALAERIDRAIALVDIELPIESYAHAKAIAAALRHAARVEAAALALTTKLVEAQEEIVRVCTLAEMHNMGYIGPKYGDELAKLREALEADTE